MLLAPPWKIRGVHLVQIKFFDKLTKCQIVLKWLIAQMFPPRFYQSAHGFGGPYSFVLSGPKKSTQAFITIVNVEPRVRLFFEALYSISWIVSTRAKSWRSKAKVDNQFPQHL